MLRALPRRGEIWILHDEHDRQEVDGGQAEQSEEKRNDFFDCSVVWDAEPPTQRFFPLTKAVEFRPESPEPFVLVDMSVRGRPTLAKCSSLAEAEELGSAKGAWA